MRYTFLLLLILPFTSLKAQSGWQKIPLLDTAGAKQYLPPAGNKMLVLIFLSPECPLCKKYAPRLRELHQTFRDEAVFAGVIPGQTFALNEIKTYQHDYKIPFVLLKDDNLALSRSLKAKVTPEVMVISAGGQLLYRGLIDNGIAGLGKQRTVVTEHYLANAILKKNKISSTTAIGCMINDY